MSKEQKIEELEAEIKEINRQLADIHKAKLKCQEDLLKKFPKLVELKSELSRILSEQSPNGSYYGYPTDLNMTRKDDVSWAIVQRTVNSEDEHSLRSKFKELQNQVFAIQTNMTFPQWQVVDALKGASYEVRLLWGHRPDRNLYVFTDGGLHFFSVIFSPSGAVYLEARSPICSDQQLFVRVALDGTTSYVSDLLESMKLPTRYKISAIRYGKLIPLT